MKKSADKQLVAVFIPPLAEVLAMAERVKEAPLTETEVARVRDEAVCMMMSVDRAGKLEEKRGYRDVNPENCWGDWHRLRVQLTGKGYLPKLVLCVLGDDAFPTRSEPILKSEGVEYEFAARDERMVNSFKASSMTTFPPLNKKDYGRIKDHTSVVYVLSRNFTAAEGPEMSRSFLRLGSRLLEAGGIAMKCESSGIAHAHSRWMELSEMTGADQPHVGGLMSASRKDPEFWSALVLAFVQLPLDSGSDLYSCGMHLLGKPDLIVSNELSQRFGDSRETQVRGAIDLFRGFALYFLSECPDGAFCSGHTFRLDSDAPRFRVVWEACEGYEEDDFFFNPFGRWRFIDPN